MTLVELMVAMSVMMVAVAAILGLLSSVQRGVENQVDLSERQSRARLAVQSLDREIRSALAMTPSLDGSTLSIYTATNLEARGGSRPSNLICAQYRVNTSTSVLEKRWWRPWQNPAVVNWIRVIPGVKNTTKTFTVDPSAYNGSVLNITLTIDGEGRAKDQQMKQLLRGDNVSAGAVNPCDGVPSTEATPGP